MSVKTVRIQIVIMSKIRHLVTDICLILPSPGIPSYINIRLVPESPRNPGVLEIV